jgi:hypothetical protein
MATFNHPQPETLRGLSTLTSVLAASSFCIIIILYSMYIAVTGADPETLVSRQMCHWLSSAIRIGPEPARKYISDQLIGLGFRGASAEPLNVRRPDSCREFPTQKPMESKAEA